MVYLVVVAHPDDEILGAGATISKLTQEKHEVNVCILSSKAEARQNKPDDNHLQQDCDEALEVLGVNQVFKGDFPNIKLNTVAHLDMVQFVEKCILQTNADVIITHHPSDLNNDHLHTSLACQAASRLFQRNSSVKPLTALLFMEVLSSTEWVLNNSSQDFRPNIFIEVGKNGVDKKITALSKYNGVMREYPHPRSKEALEALATYRGCQAGCRYAEAFELAFGRII